MEVFKENGQTGRVYCVFDRKAKMADAMKEAAMFRKVSIKKLEAVPVWIKDETLYTTRQKGGEKRTGIISHGA